MHSMESMVVIQIGKNSPYTPEPKTNKKKKLNNHCSCFDEHSLLSVNDRILWLHSIYVINIDDDNTLLTE